MPPPGWTGLGEQGDPWDLVRQIQAQQAQGEYDPYGQPAELGLGGGGQVTTWEDAYGNVMSGPGMARDDPRAEYRGGWDERTAAFNWQKAQEAIAQRAQLAQAYADRVRSGDVSRAQAAQRLELGDVSRQQRAMAMGSPLNRAQSMYAAGRLGGERVQQASLGRSQEGAQAEALRQKTYQDLGAHYMSAGEQALQIYAADEQRRQAAAEQAAADRAAQAAQEQAAWGTGIGVAGTAIGAASQAGG
jgi:hypothetical protein